LSLSTGVRHANHSFIDFDAIDGGVITSLSSPLNCGHCAGRASIIVNGRSLCIDCFLASNGGQAPRLSGQAGAPVLQGAGE
jgi:hypothetical protein